MKFGVDYYPEHWPKERWATDIELMVEAGIEVVRLAEFSWAKMEPEKEVFDFTWLDEAIEMLGQKGIKVVLGTPTAAPPIWVVEQDRDILPVNHEGKRLGFGGRHHCCQSNLTYRDHVQRFVTKMARHYKNNPFVVGWQTDNEFGNSHQNLCLCDSCRSHFHKWLENKYKTIDKLNNEWGTVFWSQTYSRFDQIPVPKQTANSHNPGLLLDWKRFTSDLIVDFQKLQLNILREECPGKFITHNFMGFFDKTNYFDLGKDLDFISHDQYPVHFMQNRELFPPPSTLAMTLDLMRGTKQQSFWIMEQLAGPTGWETLSATPRPGQIKLWTYQSVAHGADTIVYFRWRTCLFGTEQYWHGILPHSGIPGRRYDEIKQTIHELSGIMDEFKDGLSMADVGILFSYDQEWALQIQPHHPELNYVNHLKGYHKAFHNKNIPVDLLSDQDDFSRYKVLVAPLLFLMTPELSKKLESYVENGGHLVLTMRTGVKNWNNNIEPRTLPGLLSDVLGIQIFDYDCLRDIKQSVKWENDGTVLIQEVKKWCDIITLDGAESLALYNQDFYENTPAITKNKFKNGFAYYVGTELQAEMMNQLVDHIVEHSQVKALLETPEDVELTRRQKNNTNYLFVLNHNAKSKTIEIPNNWKHVAGENSFNEGALYLPAYGTAVFIEE